MFFGHEAASWKGIQSVWRTFVPQGWLCRVGDGKSAGTVERDGAWRGLLCG